MYSLGVILNDSKKLMIMITEETSGPREAAAVLECEPCTVLCVASTRRGWESRGKRGAGGCCADIAQEGFPPALFSPPNAAAWLCEVAHPGSSEKWSSSDESISEVIFARCCPLQQARQWSEVREHYQCPAQPGRGEGGGEGGGSAEAPHAALAGAM